MRQANTGEDLDHRSFAFSELTPTSYLSRAAQVQGGRTAVIDGEFRLSYRELADRSRRLSGALMESGIAPGDRVAVLASNSHVMLECHNGVPMAGAVLVPLNVRLSAGELAWLIRHSEASMLICTDEFTVLAHRVVAETGVRLIDESGYEQFLSSAAPAERPCGDERGLIAINYTSGTTGSPKGAMYHHRGAFLQALAMVAHAGLDARSRYLWALPMFHCDGWTFPWAVTAACGLHVCMRTLSPEGVWRALREHDITHFSCAPTVLAMLADAAQAEVRDPRVSVQTGGAPPGPALLARLDELGLHVTHLYGLTETFGPIAINAWRPEWDGLDSARRAQLVARQGVGNIIADRLRVFDKDGQDVPADSRTVGELAVRGNSVMLGYYRDPQATDDSSLYRKDGTYFRTGDLAVQHPDGYVEVQDRSKDVIISGGENISSVQVERAIEAHSSVLESAVVAAPDQRWGELPVAFITLRTGEPFDEAAMVEFLRAQLAGFKVPRRFVIGVLPKTSTGKVQKHVLREQLRG